MGVWEWVHLILEFRFPFLTGCLLRNTSSDDEGEVGESERAAGDSGANGGDTEVKVFEIRANKSQFY